MSASTKRHCFVLMALFNCSSVAVAWQPRLGLKHGYRHYDSIPLPEILDIRLPFHPFPENGHVLLRQQQCEVNAYLSRKLYIT